MSRNNLLVFIWAGIACAAMFLTCSGPQPLAGGTSETTNGFTAVVRSVNGSPVSHALVRLRPEGYLPDTGNAAIPYNHESIVDTFTDAAGEFRITHIDTGKYSIEIKDGSGEGAVLKTGALVDSIVDCGSAVVAPWGSIRGSIDRKAVGDGIAVYVRLIGMEHAVRVDPASGTFVLNEIPRGDHELYVNTSSISYGPKEFRASVKSDSMADVGTVTLFPYANWAYSKTIGFNTAASGADVSGNVFSFPVLIRLTSGNFTFAQAQPLGDDIRFTKSDSTPLPYEIERWDAAAGLAEVWVKIDTVFGNDSHQSIIMYWGNQQAPQLSKSTAVFDTTDGAQGVWHLGDATQNSFRDATANRYDGISPDSARPSIAEGIIGKCRQFDGIADFITMPNTADGKLNFPQGSYYTVSAWVNLDTMDHASHVIVSKGYEQYYLRVSVFTSPLTPLWEFVEFSETAKWQISTSLAASKQWTLLTGVRQGSRQFLYSNGVCVDSTIEPWVNTVPRKTSNDLSIGKFIEEVTVPVNDGYCYFRGAIDEVRICSAARSVDWIKLCYMNQRGDDKLVLFK
jgi:hypothetical protein